MEDKILNRITEITNEINELLAKRESIVSELKIIDKEIDNLCSSIHELKSLLEPTE